MPLGRLRFARLFAAKGLVCLMVLVSADSGATDADPPSTFYQPGAGHAQFLLAQALAFEHGEGVPQDTDKAAQMYCEAARLGNAEAMYSLGWMYANGRGVERSDPLAGTLFAMAAYRGHAHAEKMARSPGSTRASSRNA